MKKLLRDRSGGLSVIFIGLVFFLLVAAFLVMETGAAFERYYAAETILQRSCNSAVEANIQDEYRADNILRLDVPGATDDFRGFIASDMPDGYVVTITSIEGTESPPSLTVTGTITFSTLFKQYGFDDLTIDFTVKATNYRVT
ncbi:MAG: hypothetical protein EOM54_15750 [Clostridia bacterium]|nr:hypothetical protein [Clostridia bacterium]